MDKSKSFLKQFLAIIVFITTFGLAATINVPAGQTTIQAGLSAASDGDTVLVQPGTYTENIIWPETNGIKLISAGDSSNTIIDGGGTSVSEEEPTDYLSHIIEILNENHGGDITEDDKLNLNRIYTDMVGDEEMKVVHKSQNTDTNKRHKFDEKFDHFLLGLVEKDTNFYNKVMKEGVNKFIKDRMYDYYLKSL